MKIIDLHKTIDKGYIQIEITPEELEKYNLKLGQEVNLLSEYLLYNNHIS